MARYVPLPGSRRTLLPNSRPAGPIDPSTIATVTVRVRSAGDMAALEEAVKAQGGQRPTERTYLSDEQLAREYGAHAEDLNLSRSTRTSTTWLSRIEVPPSARSCCEAISVTY